jgi:L-alanine-DL-glutamate epimerase-like enolase superfamily enzyme
LCRTAGRQESEFAATAHLSAATAHCPYIEFLPAQLSESRLRRELVIDELEMVDGQIAIPQRPGLGIKLNLDSLEKYRATSLQLASQVQDV